MDIIVMFAPVVAHMAVQVVVMMLVDLKHQQSVEDVTQYAHVRVQTQQNLIQVLVIAVDYVQVHALGLVMKNVQLLV